MFLKSRTKVLLHRGSQGSDSSGTGLQSCASGLPCVSSSLEQMLVRKRLALLPRAVGVAEVDALAERRMIGAKHLEQPVRTRVRQVVLLQLDERCRRRVVVTCDLEAETVGFVLGVSDVREPEG